TGGEGGAFGGAVAVHHLDLGTVLLYRCHRRWGHHVPTGPHLPEAGQTLRCDVGHHPEQSGGQPHSGDLVLLQQLPHRRDVEQAGWSHHHLAAVEQRHPDLIGGGVEG